MRWGIKKPHNRVDRICTVYALYIIIFCIKSQEHFCKPADFQGFYKLISSPYTNKYLVPRRKTNAPFSFIPTSSAISP